MKIVTYLPSFQGELMVRRIDEEIPATARAVPPIAGYHIVAHSETGHHHVIDGVKAAVYEAADDEFIGWIKSLGGDGAEITHQRGFDTHEALHLPPGIYEIRRQREYTAEGFRRAAD